MAKEITRDEAIRLALEIINGRSNPTVVEITERVKRKYWF